MSKKDKKRLREEAMRKEITRRESQRLSSSPLTQDEMMSMLSFVGANIMQYGHNHDFKFVTQWVNEYHHDIQEVIRFLGANRATDDWSFCIECDPYQLFGKTDSRISWMPIEENELESLLNWLDEEVKEHGCNHDLSLTKQWLENNNLSVYDTMMALVAHGGGCDCEVVMNVEEEGIYPSATG